MESNSDRFKCFNLRFDAGSSMKAAIVVRGETIMLQGFLPEEHCKLSKELSSSAGS